MSIFLIRHGETLGNAARIVQRPDNPLSPRGVAQAERLARRLQGEGIAGILSSDLARAVMTAEAIRRATGTRVQYNALLQERNFGALRGTPYAEIDFDPFAPDYEPPNGESWTVFHARVAQAWNLVRRIADRTPGHLAVVTHGLVCRSLATYQLVLPAGEEAPLKWENTALTVIDGPTPWQVSLLNCIAHLDDLEAAPLPQSGAV